MNEFQKKKEKEKSKSNVVINLHYILIHSTIFISFLNLGIDTIYFQGEIKCLYQVPEKKKNLKDHLRTDQFGLSTHFLNVSIPDSFIMLKNVHFLNSKH